MVGTPLDVIASGPTVPDRSTFADALAILKRYGILDQIPGSVRGHLSAGAAGAIPDTPKPGDPLFERVDQRRHRRQRQRGPRGGGRGAAARASAARC